VKRPPTPRARIYDLYWYFASERQRMFERRIAGERGPWTSDPLLREFKFCNVFRAADRVSQYMFRDVCRQRNGSPVVARRLANRLVRLNRHLIAT
jgi:hypothetical protein